MMDMPDLKTTYGWIALFVFGSSVAQAQYDRNLKIWYREPAGSRWENALPVGNGRLGAMVYGNVGLENIQLNEQSVWSGSPNRNDYPEMLAALPEARRLIFEGKQAEAQKYLEESVKLSKSSGQMFEPVGSLMLAFPGHADYSRYRRELNISGGVATTTYTVGDVQYSRQVLASLPDRVIVVRLYRLTLISDGEHDKALETNYSVVDSGSETDVKMLRRGGFVAMLTPLSSYAPSKNLP
jgi:alpha-L-fucosidase 2